MDSDQIRHCPTCGAPIEPDRYVLHRDGTYRCEHCYFTNTYLDGVVHRMETGYLVTLEAFVSATPVYFFQVVAVNEDGVAAAGVPAPGGGHPAGALRLPGRPGGDVELPAGPAR